MVEPGFKFDQIPSQIFHKLSASNSNYSFWAIFGVFDFRLWISWLLFSVFLAFIFVFSSKFWSPPDKHTIWTPLKAISRTIVGFSIEVDQLTTKINLQMSMHFQIFSFSLFFGLIFWTFAGSLTSFLISNNQEALLKTFDDLKFKGKDFKLLVEEGSSTNGILLKWANQSIENHEAYKTFVEPYKNEDALQVLQDQIIDNSQQAAILGAAPRIQWFLGQIPKEFQCNYAVTTIEEIPTSPVSWMFPKNSILTPLFNKQMFELKKTGILDRLLTEHFKPMDFDCNTIQFVEIDFQLVLVLFITLILGAILSVLIVLVEQYLKH